MPFGENSYPNGITNTAMTARARPTELLRWMVMYVYLIHFKAASYHMSTTEINNVSLNPVIFKFLLKNWTHRCTKISSSTELHTRRCGKQDSSEKWAGMWSQHPPPPSILPPPHPDPVQSEATFFKISKQWGDSIKFPELMSHPIYWQHIWTLSQVHVYSSWETMCQYWLKTKVFN